MAFDFEEAFESPGFWILAGLGIAAELIGYIVSRRTGIAAFPLWQLIIVIVVTILAAIFFSTQD